MVKEVVMEAMKVGSGEKWVSDLIISLDVLGWGDLDAETLSGLSGEEVKQALKDIARRRVRECWKEEARGHPSCKC